MKRHTLTFLALSASLITGGYVFGQSPSKPAAAAPAPAPKTQKMVKVATLSTVEANQQFQANVQFLQGQRQRAIDLNGQIEREKDAKKKKDLQKELEALMVKLNENNQAMARTYGFSLTHNYTIEIEKAHVYALVTEEEAAQIEKAQKEREKAPAKKK